MGKCHENCGCIECEYRDACIAELEAKVERLETAITTAIGRIDNLNDFGDIREVLEWALEEDHD